MRVALAVAGTNCQFQYFAKKSKLVRLKNLIGVQILKNYFLWSKIKLDFFSCQNVKL